MQAAPSQSRSTPTTRLTPSNSVDSFLSWIAAPSAGAPKSSKSRKARSNLHPNAESSPASSSPDSASVSSTESSSPSGSSPRQRASSSKSTTGGTFILADATRLRELSRSPLEEMGLPLFGGPSKPKASVAVPQSNISSQTNTGSTKKHRHQHHHKHRSGTETSLAAPAMPESSVTAAAGEPPNA